MYNLTFNSPLFTFAAKMLLHISTNPCKDNPPVCALKKTNTDLSQIST